MGTKSTHPAPLSEVEKYAVAGLLSKLAEQNRWTPTEIFRMLGRACDAVSDNENIRFAEFDPDLKTIKKLIDTAEPINDWHMWGFFLWLKKDYGNQLRDQQIGEQLKRKDTEIKEVRRLLDYWGDVSPRDVQHVGGVYKLYRPSHVRPQDKVICSKLEIGIGEEFFTCHLSSKFHDSFGDEREDFYRGKIIPYGIKLMAIMVNDIPDYDHPDKKFIDRKEAGSLILHFDDVEYNRSDAAAQGLTGTAIIAVGNGPSSAWPVIARRSNDPFEPTEMDSLEFSDPHNPIRQSLNRGAVHWNPSYYPTLFKTPQP